MSSPILTLNGQKTDANNTTVQVCKPNNTCHTIQHIRMAAFYPHHIATPRQSHINWQYSDCARVTTENCGCFEKKRLQSSAITKPLQPKQISFQTLRALFFFNQWASTDTEDASEMSHKKNDSFPAYFNALSSACSWPGRLSIMLLLLLVPQTIFVIMGYCPELFFYSSALSILLDGWFPYCSHCISTFSRKSAYNCSLNYGHTTNYVTSLVLSLPPQQVV